MYSVLHGQTLTVSAANGVLDGATDPNNLHLTTVLESGPSHGNLTLNTDGSFDYTPVSTFAGIDYFDVEAYDGNFYSTPQQVEVSVTERPPTAANPMYSLLNDQTLSVSAADGLVAQSSGDSPLTASLVATAAHGSLTLNSDGSFSYTPDAAWVGTDTFKYAVSDGVSSSTGTVTLTADYGVVSAVDQTKLPVDTIQVGQPILSDPFNSPLSSPLPAGGSGGTTISAAPADGAPATAHNLSLVYNSVLAQPDQVIEADIGFTQDFPVSDTLTAALTFNGVSQPSVYFNMNSMGGNGHVHIAMQVDTSGLASGRYPYSLTVSGQQVAAPVTIDGAVNVVNDAASPFGKGWDMPGLYHLFNNTVSGVPAGALLSTGDGGAWYYAQNADGSYTSPNGPFAFSALTTVSGGGWQLLTHEGVTFNFNSGGYLTSRVERTGESTTYNWSGNELTSIVDQFGRVIPLTYSGGLLSSLQDFAGNTWTIAHSGTNLISITAPDPGGGSPVWQYAYAGNYMSSATSPNGDETQFTLDSFHRLSGTALPGSASTADTSEQDFGYGSTNSSSPANLTLAASVTPTSTNADGNQSSYQTDQFGDVTYSVDAYGNATSIERDPNGLPTQITLPPPTAGAAAPVTTINYDTTGDETSAGGAQPSYGTYTYTTDSFGQWATFTDSLGDEWLRTFDTRGDILSEQDPSGALVSWTYDTYGRPLTMTMPAPNDAAGTVTVNYHYDTDERLTEIVWPDSSNEQFGYNADDYQTSYQDENGHSTATTRDALNRPVLVTDALGNSVATTYDKDSNILTTRDELGDVVTNVYNARDELTQQTLPDPDGSGPLTSPVLSYTYSATGKELTETNGLNQTVSLAYDKLDRLSSETLPPPASGQSGPETTFGYDNLSRKVSQTNALAGTTTWAYANTDISQLTSETLPAPSGSGSGPATSFFYDADGRQDQVENALGQFTTTSFTVNGQTASVKDNLGDVTSDGYGNGGELLSVTDALNHTSHDQYDSRYRLIQTTDAAGGVTQTVLDPAGNRLKLIDPDGNETDWTYSATNLPLTETNALGTTTTTYDAASQITGIEDADGRVRDFVHDNLGRVTAENWMQGSTVIASMNYAYDAANELTSASDANSAYAFAYNGDSDVTSVNNAGTPNVPNVVLSSDYDLLGDRTSLSATIAGTADFLNNYSYDADQRLTMVQQQDVNGGDVVSPKEVDFGYNALAQFTEIVDCNFIGVGPRLDVATGDYSYDNDSRLTGLTYTSNAGKTQIDSFGWAYNAANLVTSFTSIDGTAGYGYDPTNQLTSATYTAASGGHQPANENESYDLNGNRTNTGYATGADNLLTSDGTFSYQHDADGNTTLRTRISNAYATDYKTTYTWDYRNRLTDVEYFDNNGVLTKHVHYVYDVFDKLIGEEDDTTGGGAYNHVEYYVLDSGQPVLQFNGSQTLTARYFASAEESVSSLTQGGPVYWSLADNHGSIRDVVDNSGNPVDHIAYATFGQIVYESNPAIPRWEGYAAQHLSAASGLMLSGARWYDPATGRWLSQDPTGFAGQDSDLSRYVGNDPTNATDPSGDLSTTQVTAMIVFPWMTPAILAMEAARATQASESKAAAEASMSHALDDYANWFNSWSAGKALSNAMAPGITSMLGEQYLAGASDGELVGITALGVTAGVVGGMAGTALAGAAGLSGYGAAAAAGAIGGGAEYLGWTVGGQAISGGQSADPSLVGLATSMAGGAAGGVLGKGATDLGGAVLNQIPCNWGGTGTCFIAGTQVLVPGEPTAALAATRIDVLNATSREEGEHDWIWSVLLAGVGIAGLIASRSRRPHEDRERTDAALRALFGEEPGTVENDDGDLPVALDRDEFSQRIDALCAALFQGDEPADDLSRPVRFQPLACAVVPSVVRGRRATIAPDTSHRRTQPARGARKANQATKRGMKSRLGTIWLAVCLALAALLGLRPPSAPEPPGTAAGSSVLPGTSKHASRAIEDIRVGQRVLGENPDLAECEHSTATAVEPATWRLVRLHAKGRWEDGTLDTVEVETLQPLFWIAASGARIGGSVPIPCDLDELALPLDMRGTVTAIEPCPELEEGHGHLVLLTVNHLNNTVCDLMVTDAAGHRETIGVTAIHRFYSDTRRDWVAAGNLRIGEQLRGIAGPLTVERLTRRFRAERVYNMTVEREHVYQVTSIGALVHNTYGSGSELPPIGNFGGDGASLSSSVLNAKVAANQAAQAEAVEKLSMATLNYEIQYERQMIKVLQRQYEQWFTNPN